jgi:hypothetical protein
MPRIPKYKRCIAEKYGRARKEILSLLGDAKMHDGMMAK